MASAEAWWGQGEGSWWGRLSFSPADRSMAGAGPARGTGAGSSWGLQFIWLGGWPPDTWSQASGVKANLHPLWEGADGSALPLAPLSPPRKGLWALEPVRSQLPLVSAEKDPQTRGKMWAGACPAAKGVPPQHWSSWGARFIK